MRGSAFGNGFRFGLGDIVEHKLSGEVFLVKDVVVVGLYLHEDNYERNCPKYRVVNSHYIEKYFFECELKKHNKWGWFKFLVS